MKLSSTWAKRCPPTANILSKCLPLRFDIFIDSSTDTGMNSITTSASRQSSSSIITAMAIICKKPTISVSIILWMELPIVETSSVMRSSIWPTGVLSTKLTGSRLILAESLMRRAQVK